VFELALVHLVGPAYSPEEREGMDYLAALLEAGGFEVYLRQRDGLPPEPASQEVRENDALLERAAFAQEIFPVLRCDCLVFNMNGRIPDDNGAFLAAVAFTLGRPVVLYKRDHRTKLFGNDNAMLSGLSFDFKFVKRPEKLLAEVNSAILQAASLGKRLPPWSR
jgi:nucleoside 2-deoxyribosyltransferase